MATFVFNDRETLRPAFQNLHAPGGVLITRRHPPAPPEATDHAALSGHWLAFGDINGVDFWRNKGMIQHEEFTAAPTADGDRVTFQTSSRFRTSAGAKLATLRGGVRGV